MSSTCLPSGGRRREASGERIDIYSTGQPISFAVPRSTARGNLLVLLFLDLQHGATCSCAKGTPLEHQSRVLGWHELFCQKITRHNHDAVASSNY
ncbi:hypothetical protein BaRGS_00019089 [Batillaria attramentaria]|uniref:Uncharacterized protein n=1 Tax=Batillaria attramentaria TaxID=370345 RepID=A0ABD0KR86_9CAEN